MRGSTREQACFGQDTRNQRDVQPSGEVKWSMAPSGKSLLRFDRSARTMDARFAELTAKLRQNRPSDDVELLRRAYEFAAEQHGSQKRESGEPFLSHPLEVAHVLADMKLDVTTVSAALLHDVVEDTQIPLSRIAELFGPVTARLVEGVTKISRLDLLTPETRQAENLRKMLLAMVNDVRVVMIKLVDRLHNMRTLEFLAPERQQRIARETIDVYAPIAHRLGMGLIRGELEDLGFRYLEPTAFLELQKAVTSRSKANEKFLTEVQTAIREKLVENGIPADVEGRVKRLYSIHQKIQRQQRTLDQIYDLLAIRIITDATHHCYQALGVIHQMWRPVPGRFKDYIAMPRPNLYQSLHTTVLHQGQPFEVQIRTQEMHRISDQGVAAHWKYKDGREVSSADDQRIVWMRQLIEWAKEMQEPSEFLATLKVDLYPDEVYAFTPKGRVIALPRGATAIDFAYAVHTEIGNQCSGAKVNGQMVPLRHAVSNGDVVEILTQKGHAPSRDWLSVTKTSRARSKIRHWINQNERLEAVEVGRRLVEREARQFDISLKRVAESELLRVAAEYGCARVDDLYADLGFGKYSARQVLSKALNQPFGEPEQKQQPAPGSPAHIVSTVKRMLGMKQGAILVRGQGDLMVYLAKCCSPIPGDDIIGYVTRGRGVAVHNTSCPNVQNLLYQTERRISVEWAESPDSQFTVSLIVRTQDRPGMLADITSIISESGSNIRTFASRPDNLRARVEVTLEIGNRKQLERIIANIKKVSGVFGVDRVYHV
ncbi:MAG TPA: bifunctional (p)ppGpp synthetase/guanosine-3',5'-bis(diphosphate) 3'-pyrophosphohydrolase [Candidatus Acidoferrales bacterium]|nr:bifunctional (p)ppGpp synthetase/guanosine-3',5'-bis(diphosphate) 3'-pyrophosphohydrolase [Candidatus Acidoferrales bacterium]